MFSLSAEAEEFDVYEKYARDILSPKSRHTLDSLLPRQIVSDALRYIQLFELPSMLCTHDIVQRKGYYICRDYIVPES